MLLVAAPVAAPLSGQEPLPPPPETGVTGAVTAPAGVLTLQEVLDAARTSNPRLLALRSVADATGAREPTASTLPDPMLQLGIMNVALPDFSANMMTSMAPSVQVMQMVPFPGKLSLRGEVAGYATGMADATVDEAWWEVRTRTATVFYEIYSLDRRIEVMRSTLELLREFETIARAMYSAGTGRQADVLRASVEIARMDGEIERMRAMRTAMAARLNALLDRPSDTPVPTPVLDPLPAEAPARDTLLTWAEETRPVLERGRLGVEQAGSRVDLARRDIWPDFTVGFQYGQRDRGAGVERMGSAMVGFSVPVFASRRQIPARQEAEAMRRMARAELDGLRAEVDARVGELLAELERTRRLIALYRDEILPQARITVESALSSYRVGSVDFMTLVDAEMMVNRYEGELHVLLADHGKAVAGLEAAVGRLLPRTPETMAEER